jgi:hypothetical protein
MKKKKDVRLRRRERDKIPEAHNGTDEEGGKEEESVGLYVTSKFLLLYSMKNARINRVTNKVSIYNIYPV